MKLIVRISEKIQSMRRIYQMVPVQAVVQIQQLILILKMMRIRLRGPHVTLIHLPRHPSVTLIHLPRHLSVTRTIS